MAELIKPADSEQAVIDELSPIYTIGTGIPAQKPELFIRVVHVGGGQRNLVTDQPMLTVEVFHPRESVAADTASDVIARLQLAARLGRLGNEVCYDISIVGLPQNYPLPSVPSHKRYLATVAPVLRRRVATI